ncbi:MAG: GNAT family N-acetyltransferase [Flavisolibacter sp.]
MKELFLSAYGIAPTSSSFVQRYDTSSLGCEVIGFLAIHNATDTVAAFYGVFPVTVLISGKEVLAAQSGDTMTHKDHQRKGLFTRLVRLTFDTCTERGILLAFGLPNANSYHGAKKVNWLHTDDVDRFDLKLSFKTFPLPKLFGKLGWFQSYHRYARTMLKQYIIQTPASFTNTAAPLYGRILRNEAYLNYKKDENKFFIRLDEVSFWIKLTDIFWIGDIDDYQKMNAVVIEKLKKLAFRLGYNTISFHINKSIEKPNFLSAFKEYESEPLCYHYFNKDLENARLVITGADFDTW